MPAECAASLSADNMVLYLQGLQLLPVPSCLSSYPVLLDRMRYWADISTALLQPCMSADADDQHLLQGRDDIVYRSGRVRSPGETNGKACNLNNTLHWLYPKEKCVADEEVSRRHAALLYLHRGCLGLPQHIACHKVGMKAADLPAA